MPRPFWDALPGHDVSFVEREGWKGRRNGELLRLVAQRFDALVSCDQSLPHQNALSRLRLSLVIVPTNRLGALRANVDAVMATLAYVSAQEGPVLVRIARSGARSGRRLDVVDAEPLRLSPVPPFTV